jgi:hypothetical protein
MFQRENYERLIVFSKLKKTQRMMRVMVMCALRRVYVISGSVQYLLLMDMFPSALGGRARRRVYVRGSLVMGLV